MLGFRRKRKEEKRRTEEERQRAKEAARLEILQNAEDKANFPSDFPELNQKIKLIYIDDSNGFAEVKVLEGFVTNRFFYLSVGKDNSAYDDYGMFFIRISSLRWYGRIGNQNFMDIDYNGKTKTWTYNDERVILKKI